MHFVDTTKVSMVRRSATAAKAGFNSLKDIFRAVDRTPTLSPTFILLGVIIN